MKILKSLKGNFSRLGKIGSLFYFIFKEGVFKADAVTTILKILGKLTELEYPNLKETVFYRSSKHSSELLNALIKTYLKSKSERTLEQLTTVFRDEVIGREQHGRK